MAGGFGGGCWGGRFGCVDAGNRLHPSASGAGVVRGDAGRVAVTAAGRRLGESIIGSRERTVRRFVEFTGGWPWSWTAGQLESWIATGGWAHSTVRSYQGAVAVFLEYVCDNRYGWVVECEQRVGARPAQICHEWNTARHVCEYEGRPARRPLTRAELQAFFDAADDWAEQAVTSGRKGWLAAFRDAALFKVCYGFGLRRREVAMLDVADFTANPAAPQLGGLGVCQVRFGKAMRGSPPRRRSVAAVMPWALEALEQYLTLVRPRYAAAAHPALWLTERAGGFRRGRSMTGSPDGGRRLVCPPSCRSTACVIPMSPT
ncbi:tyrosine-family recombinase/integrase [Mycobacterium kansasii 824]|nr:tyrosine-family recombinase/integrase [Mycobacterium kansasii 824]